MGVRGYPFYLGFWVSARRRLQYCCGVRAAGHDLAWAALRGAAGRPGSDCPDFCSPPRSCAPNNYLWRLRGLAYIGPETMVWWFAIIAANITGGAGAFQYSFLAYPVQLGPTPPTPLSIRAVTARHDLARQFAAGFTGLLGGPMWAG